MIAGGDAMKAALLLRMTRSVTARHDLDDVLSETFRALRALVQFGGGSIQLVDDEGWIRMAAAEPAAPDHVMAQRVPLGGSVAGRIVLTEQPVYLEDLMARAVPDGRRTAVSGGVRSYFGVPLVADGHAVGLLQVDSPQPCAWSESDRALIVSVAPVVAAAIQNARSHARAESAHAHAAHAARRLSDARQLASTVRACAESGDTEELLRQLDRLEQVLSADGGGALRAPVAEPRLPVQRTVAAKGLNQLAG